MTYFCTSFNILLCILFFSFSANAQTNTIKGSVLDETGKPLINASIYIKETVIGTVTEKDGSFKINTNLKPPFVLTTSFIGYRTSEYLVNDFTTTVEIILQSQPILSDEVIVTASRLEEKSLKSSITVERLNNKDIRLTASPTFFDALENVKGVQTLTASLGFKVFNTRGFANTTNVRFLQLVDGVDNQAPVIGSSIANAVGPTELDIERVEIIPGTASALYGMNSINGLSSFFTKDPFTYQGLSIYQRTGINHINDYDTKAHPFSETAIRYAKSINDRFAVKINFAYTKGFDWISNQQVDLNPKANTSVNLVGDQNPALDPVNSYGNESPNRKTLSLNGKNYVVARTGYYEKDITDYKLENVKGDLSLHYKLSNKIIASYTYKMGKIDNVYQRTNRFKLDDYSVQQHVLHIKSPGFNLSAYLTRELSGKSYNIRSLAENLDRSFKTDDKWFNDYKTSYLNSINQGTDIAESHLVARQKADEGRYIPGTPKSDSVASLLNKINNWDIGSALRTSSNIYHIEGQYDLSDKVKFVNVLTGFDFRAYSVTPDGNYFINPKDPGENLLYRKGGAFIQLSKDFIRKKLNVNAALRYDKNEYFKGFFNPRLSAVFHVNEDHHFRISYQNGYRFPSLFEAFSNVNSGGVKRVGGLREMSSGIFEDSYIRATLDAFQTAINTDINKNGLSANEAIVKSESLIKKSDYDYIEPERINSLEFGYKSLFLNSRLFIDIDFYFNVYNNFIAQVEVNQLKNRSVSSDSIPYYLNDKTRQDRYRLWTNSKSTVYNYGSSFGLKYNLYKKYTLGGNISYAKLYRKKYNDGLEEAFNTPAWIANLCLSNIAVYKNIGFNVTCHWQDGFLWQSSLGTGQVPAYHNMDLQFTLNLFNEALFLKVGGTNVLNKKYYQFVAGPSIGAFYYTALTFNL